MVHLTERVTLNEDALARLDQWSAQVQASRPGVTISRRDLLNWLVLSHSEALSAAETKALSEKHYDELRFLQYALKELKRAKLRGENVTLQELMGSGSSLQEIASQLAPRKRRQRRNASGVAPAETDEESGALNDALETGVQQS